MEPCTMFVLLVLLLSRVILVINALSSQSGTATKP